MTQTSKKGYSFNELEKHGLIVDEDGKSILGKDITKAILEEVSLEITLAKVDRPIDYKKDAFYQKWSKIKDDRFIHVDELFTVFPECKIDIRIEGAR